MEKQITEMTRAGRECFFQWVWFSSFILFFIFYFFAFGVVERETLAS
jgi:hypothetical protein